MVPEARRSASREQRLTLNESEPRQTLPPARARSVWPYGPEGPEMAVAAVSAALPRAPGWALALRAARPQAPGGFAREAGVERLRRAWVLPAGQRAVLQLPLVWIPADTLKNRKLGVRLPAHHPFPAHHRP
jgi:hypothetical protein